MSGRTTIETFDLKEVVIIRSDEVISVEQIDRFRKEIQKLKKDCLVIYGGRIVEETEIDGVKTKVSGMSISTHEMHEVAPQFIKAMERLSEE